MEKGTGIEAYRVLSYLVRENFLKLIAKDPGNPLIKDRIVSFAAPMYYLSRRLIIREDNGNINWASFGDLPEWFQTICRIVERNAPNLADADKAQLEENYEICRDISNIAFEYRTMTGLNGSHAEFMEFLISTLDYLNDTVFDVNQEWFRSGGDDETLAV